MAGSDDDGFSVDGQPIEGVRPTVESMESYLWVVEVVCELESDE